jgi:hypothetical protein
MKEVSEKCMTWQQYNCCDKNKDQKGQISGDFLKKKKKTGWGPTLEIA